MVQATVGKNCQACLFRELLLKDQIINQLKNTYNLQNIREG